MSFFRRNEQGKFKLESENDLWRLLAGMTFIKTNSAIEFHLRQRRAVSREVGSETNHNGSCPQAPSNDATASAVAVMAELLEQILERLPPEHQQILVMRLENYTIEEIADRVSVSTRTVQRAIKAARSIAAKLLDNSNSPEL